MAKVKNTKYVYLKEAEKAIRNNERRTLAPLWQITFRIGLCNVIRVDMGIP